MIYEYICAACSADFDVVRRMAEIDEPASCPACSHQNSAKARRIPRTHFYGAKVEDATFDPAFGKVIRNSKHRKDEAKARGMIEIGNEKPETVHKHFDDQRKEKQRKAWESA